MSRINYSSGSRWEDVVGYSRVVKVNDIVEVAGTTATNNDQIVGRNDYFLQTQFILEKIEGYLKNSGASISDVVRSRIFVCDISKWEDVAKAHHLFFGDIKPVSTMVEVNRLIHPDILVEIEVTAIITNK